MKNNKILHKKINALSEKIDELDTIVTELSSDKLYLETETHAKIRHNTVELNEKLLKTEESIKHIASLSKEINDIIEKRA